MRPETLWGQLEWAISVKTEVFTMAHQPLYILAPDYFPRTSSITILCLILSSHTVLLTIPQITYQMCFKLTLHSIFILHDSLYHSPQPLVCISPPQSIFPWPLSYKPLDFSILSSLSYFLDILYNLPDFVYYQFPPAPLQYNLHEGRSSVCFANYCIPKTWNMVDGRHSIHVDYIKGLWRKS